MQMIDSLFVFTNKKSSLLENVDTIPVCYSTNILHQKAKIS